MNTRLSSLPGRLPPLNPVLARELKQRMRGRLTWLVVTGYLAVLAVILRFVYLGASQTLSGTDFADPLASATVGRSIFHWLLFFMLMLVCFIVPGLTASAISGERERQTLVSLQVTLLRPRSIVLGKLLSSLAFTSFLVIASLPLLSVPFLVGGVSVAEVFKGVLMILLTAVVLACLAVGCSAVLRRTQAATVVAYGLTAALTIGTFIVYGGQRAMDGPVNKASPAILALNPFVATADVVHGRNDFDSFDSFGSPFTGLVDLVRPDITGFDTGGGFVEIDRGGMGVLPPGRPMPMPVPIPVPVPVPNATVAPFPPPAAVQAESPAGAKAQAEGAAAEAKAQEILAPNTTVPEGLGSDAGVRAVAGSTDDPLLLAPDQGIGVFADDMPGFQVGPFGEELLERPRAHVLGMPMWLAWLVGSTMVGGLSLFVAVRKVSLPSARDSS
jgi:ABC-type transport system involved in multi-copper enzyme maturation permease subunit